MILNCCICQTDKYEKPFKKIENIWTVRCAGCGLVYLKDAYEEDTFIQNAKEHLSDRSGQKVEYWSFPPLYFKYQKIFDGFFAERLARIRKFHPNFKTMFDVGCAYGLWMDFCRKEGIEVKGIDLSADVIKYARGELKLNAEQSTLEEYNFKEPYDLVMMCDILEHLANPNKELTKVKNGLKQDGILLIQVPTLLGFKIPRQHSLGLPYHYWQFSLDTLGLLLEKNGFKVLKYWTGILGVIGVYEQGGPSLATRLKWRISTLLKLGNRLIVLAGKKT